MFRKIAFIVHPEKQAAWDAAALYEKLLLNTGNTAFYPQKGMIPDSCDLVITFGGDGTLLMGARNAIRWGCPLLGINHGTIGFLTECEPDQPEIILNAIRCGEWITEMRSLLKIQVEGEQETFLALNDAVITRGGYARLIQVETTVNADHWGTFIADGVIAATPTGSTGYSLSAGGPVVTPDVQCMIITPVCAHSLQHSPCIVPGNSIIRFHLREEREQRAELQVDGQSLRKIQGGSTVIVTEADEKLQLLRLKPYRFFDVMRRKFNQWTRSEQEGEI